MMPVAHSAGFEIGSFRFQPSELAKILIILFFAYFFMKHEEKINTPKVLILSFVLAGIPLALILKQPDLSTTIVTALIFAALLFVAGLSYKIVTGVLAVSIPSAVIMFTFADPGQTSVYQKLSGDTCYGMALPG